MLVIPLVCLSMRMRFQFRQPNKRILTAIKNSQKSNLEPINELRQIRQKNSNRLISVQLNINGIKTSLICLLNLSKKMWTSY